jgi:hypothetical protein
MRSSGSRFNREYHAYDRDLGRIDIRRAVKRQNPRRLVGGIASSGHRGERLVAVSGRPISSPVPRHPDPPPVSLGPMTGNPIRPRVGAGDIAAGHPYPAVSVPAPVAGLPNHRGAGRRRDRLLLRRRRSSRPAISLTGISRRRSTGITRRLTGIGIGGRRILLCNRRQYRGHQGRDGNY